MLNILYVLHNIRPHVEWHIDTQLLSLGCSTFPRKHVKGCFSTGQCLVESYIFKILDIYKCEFIFVSFL